MSDLWIPNSKAIPMRHVRLEDSGPFTGGGRKLLIHTTEGGTLDSVVSTLRAKRAGVHFVIDPRTGHVIQCIPLNRAGRGLAHPSGPETNRANVIQIEVVGFAAQTGDWPDKYYYNLAQLARAIRRRFPFPAKLRGFHRPKRFTGNGFVDFAGICGHVHVPGNDHWDPGTGFNGALFRTKIIHGPTARLKH